MLQVSHYFNNSYAVITNMSMAGMPPDCADPAGEPKLDAPVWCLSRWCYVHREVCDRKDLKQSVFFGADTDLWYSYAKTMQTIPYKDHEYIGHNCMDHDYIERSMVLTRHRCINILIMITY